MAGKTISLTAWGVGPQQGLYFIVRKDDNAATLDARARAMFPLLEEQPFRWETTEGEPMELDYKYVHRHQQVCLRPLWMLEDSDEDDEDEEEKAPSTVVSQQGLEQPSLASKQVEISSAPVAPPSQARNVQPGHSREALPAQQNMLSLPIRMGESAKRADVKVEQPTRQTAKVSAEKLFELAAPMKAESASSEAQSPASAIENRKRNRDAAAGASGKAAAEAATEAVTPQQSGKGSSSLVPERKRIVERHVFDPSTQRGLQVDPTLDVETSQYTAENAIKSMEGERGAAAWKTVSNAGKRDEATRDRIAKSAQAAEKQMESAKTEITSGRFALLGNKEEVSAPQSSINSAPKPEVGSKSREAKRSEVVDTSSKKPASLPVHRPGFKALWKPFLNLCAPMRVGAEELDTLCFNVGCIGDHQVKDCDHKEYKWCRGCETPGHRQNQCGRGFCKHISCQGNKSRHLVAAHNKFADSGRGGVRPAELKREQQDVQDLLDWEEHMKTQWRFSEDVREQGYPEEVCKALTYSLRDGCIRGRDRRNYFNYRLNLVGVKERVIKEMLSPLRLPDEVPIGN